MKKLTKEVVRFLDNQDMSKERLIVAFVCAEPQTETEKLYKNIIQSVIHDPYMLHESETLKDMLNVLEKCMSYAEKDTYVDLEVLDTTELIVFLRTIKNFKYNNIEVKFDAIMREIIEPTAIHKIKKIIDQVDELMKSIDVITF